MHRAASLLLAGLLLTACGGPSAAPVTTLAPAPTTTVPPTPATAEEAGVPWWHDRVFYEVFVRSFADSDGDGIGDLRGAIDRLDYLNDGDPSTDDDLGVTGIWLMPVFESPSYHGYDVTDYRTVEADYGTNDDLRAFVAAAHERGIAVILDLVVNHTSVEHPWFVASAAGDPGYADWYMWSDTDPGWPGPWGQAVWHRLGGRYYYGVFWEGMPDLNLADPDVAAEMLDVARFWIDEAGVDGYRLDAARHLVEQGDIQESTPGTLAWLARFRQALPADVMIVGEVWSAAAEVAGYVPGSLDLAFEFDLAAATLQAIATADASLVTDALDRVGRLYSDGRTAVFLTNHDQVRVMSEVSSSWPKARLAAALLLTYPGVPFLYYGEEVGMAGRKPDPRLRTPMAWTADRPGVGFTTGTPWEEPQTGFDAANVASQTGDPGSLLSWYRDLIRLRGGHPALRYGETVTLESGWPAVVSYLRTIGDDHVLVVANLGRADVVDYGLTSPDGLFDGPVTAGLLLGAGSPAGPEVEASGGFSGYRPLPVLGGRTVLVLSLTETG